MAIDDAQCDAFSHWLPLLGEQLDRFLRFEHADAACHREQWQVAFGETLPQQGIGIELLLAEMGELLIPNGSAVSKPGFSSFITTGATTAGALASLAGDIASPQRIGITAFNHLEELSLKWMAELFQLPPGMQGLYSSGGSAANIVALGAARQWAFERRGIDVANEGVSGRCVIYVTQASHHTIHRAAAVLGLGRRSIRFIDSDESGRMLPDDLQWQVEADLNNNCLPIAVVANAGTTSTGAIDPLRSLGDIAGKYNIWFHIDGAYGLPGILDPNVAGLYDGLSLADSVIVDPHKWLGAPVGIGTTYVRDRGLLQRAFTQGDADYFEGSFSDDEIINSMDSIGIPYNDFGLELSAPARGAVVWALLREIGAEGIRKRVCRHNAMARSLSEKVMAHPDLELLDTPTLSICCFRYLGAADQDCDKLNQKIHRQLVHNGRNIPSTAIVNKQFAIRPCFIGARTHEQHADDLIDEVLAIGAVLREKEK